MGLTNKSGVGFLPVLQQRGSPEAQGLLRSSQQQLLLFSRVLLTSKARVHPLLWHFQRWDTTSSLQQHLQSAQPLPSELLARALELLSPLSCPISPGRVLLLSALSAPVAQAGTEPPLSPGIPAGNGSCFSHWSIPTPALLCHRVLGIHKHSSSSRRASALPKMKVWGKNISGML